MNALNYQWMWTRGRLCECMCEYDCVQVFGLCFHLNVCPQSFPVKRTEEAALWVRWTLTRVCACTLYISDWVV